MDNIRTGNLIKEIRTEKGITQKELAEKLCVSVAAVSKWENGRGFPDISLLEPLTAELGISITELINGSRDSAAAENDAAVKEIIEISGKERKFERARQIFIILVFTLTVITINAFVVFDAVSGYQGKMEFSFPTPSLIGLFMFLFGGNAVVFALFNLFLGNRFSIQKAMQIFLFSEACCAASIWLANVYTDYKVSINDISAVLDTANALEIYSRMIFLITNLLNVFAYWKIVKTK